MILVGQSIDDRDPRVRGEAPDDAVLISAYHDDIDHAGNDARSIFHRLASPQLRIAGGKINRRPSQLVHSCFK
jgi:hypothetical protein